MGFADWSRYMGMTEWHHASFEGWPGWDRDAGAEEPVSVTLLVTKGKDKSSHKMASEFDDIATNDFYWRDWTESSLPFVDDGETYTSKFWFKKREDRAAFLKMFPKVRQVVGRSV